eukprot:scaffold19258_cov120-Cylindrotheca_fusiformis.AAC.1
MIVDCLKSSLAKLVNCDEKNIREGAIRVGNKTGWQKLARSPSLMPKSSIVIGNEIMKSDSLVICHRQRTSILHLCAPQPAVGNLNI